MKPEDLFNIFVRASENAQKDAQSLGPDSVAGMAATAGAATCRTLADATAELSREGKIQ